VGQDPDPVRIDRIGILSYGRFIRQNRQKTMFRLLDSLKKRIDCSRLSRHGE